MKLSYLLAGLAAVALTMLFLSTGLNGSTVEGDIDESLAYLERYLRGEIASPEPLLDQLTQIEGGGSFDLDHTHLDQINEMIVSGDEQAMKVAFALSMVTDGALTSQIEIMLGQAIALDAAAFLRIFDHYLDQLSMPENYILNLGPDYVDELESATTEYERRYMLFREVEHAPEYAQLFSLHILSERISQLREMLLQEYEAGPR